jgi:hypothetical protein
LRQRFVGVQVGQAHGQRVQPQVAGHVAQNGFDGNHALRAAKTSVGGVALRVGFAAVAADGHVLQKVRVVGMKNGPVRHGARQVGRKPAVRQLRQLQAAQAALVVKAHGVVVAEGVAFAGDQKVVIAVQAHLHRAAGVQGGQGGPHGQVAALRFFATKATAHAAAFHPHLMQGQPQCMGHPVLNFTRVLRAAVNQPLVLFLWQGVGNLAFQVEVLLPTYLECA